MQASLNRKMSSESHQASPVYDSCNCFILHSLGFKAYEQYAPLYINQSLFILLNCASVYIIRMRECVCMSVCDVRPYRRSEMQVISTSVSGQRALVGSGQSGQSAKR